VWILTISLQSLERGLLCTSSTLNLKVSTSLTWCLEKAILVLQLNGVNMLEGVTADGVPGLTPVPGH
jgi:hypothetical protein